MLSIKIPSTSIQFLLVAIALTIILSIISYNSFIEITNQIKNLSNSNLKLNSQVTIYSISSSLSNAISAITSNLEVISKSPSFKYQNLSNIQSLIETGQSSTNYLTDGYYFLDKDGKLIAFSGKNNKNFSQYYGIDLSYREYFKVPKNDGTMFVSGIIDSNDKVPRIYLSLPVYTSSFANTSSFNNNSKFYGVIFASIKAKTLGNFLENQIHPQLKGSLGFLGTNGGIIYSQNQSLIGQNFFGFSVQSYLNNILKEKKNEFNFIIDKAIKSDSGISEFNFGNITIVTYQSVFGPNNVKVGTLFLTIPNELAGDVLHILDYQQLSTSLIIFVVAAIGVISAFVVLKWNESLKKIVNKKTEELVLTIQKLEQSNQELRLAKKDIEKINKEITVANIKLEKANEELKLHDMMQKDFINIAAHELRTPVQAITGNLELIEMEYLPAFLNVSSKEKTDNREIKNMLNDEYHLQEFVERLTAVYRNSYRLDRLVNNILDMSRIETNKLILNKEHFDINEKITNVIREIYSEIHSFKNDYKKVLDIHFIPYATTLMVYADKIKVFEVLSNLINNAIKFSEDKPITISVDYMNNKKNNELKNKKQIIVSIKDEGKGIDPEVLPRLFTKFNSKSFNGIGLGLYISKNIIEAHGGKIWAQNNPDGKGAIFSFTLPVDDLLYYK